MKKEATTALTATRNLADAMKSTTKNSNLQAYFQGCMTQADTMTGS